MVLINNLILILLGNAWNNEERVVAAGYDNGEVKLFDLKAMSTLSELTISSGVCIEKNIMIFFNSNNLLVNKLSYLL